MAEHQHRCACGETWPEPQPAPVDKDWLKMESPDRWGIWPLVLVLAVPGGLLAGLAVLVFGG